MVAESYASETVSVVPPSGEFRVPLPILEKNLPHQITIRYPSKYPLTAQVTVTAPNAVAKRISVVRRADPDHSSPAVSAWRAESFVYYPSGNDDMLSIKNLSSNEPLRFESITIAAGPQTLSPQRDRQRSQRMVAVSLSSTTWINSLTTDIADPPSFQPESVQLYRLAVATKRLADYARAAVQTPSSYQRFQARKVGAVQGILGTVKPASRIPLPENVLAADGPSGNRCHR